MEAALFNEAVAQVPLSATPVSEQLLVGQLRLVVDVRSPQQLPLQDLRQQPPSQPRTSTDQRRGAACGCGRVEEGMKHALVRSQVVV